ncbi:MAG: DNA (cytosine-5-)-methyltransferase [Gammaproteobacteria bacterium]
MTFDRDAFYMMVVRDIGRAKRPRLSAAEVSSFLPNTATPDTGVATLDAPDAIGLRHDVPELALETAKTTFPFQSEPTDRKPAPDQISVDAPIDVTPAVLSGWLLDPRERGDFYHAPRAFPPEVAAWRRRLIELIMVRPDPFKLSRRRRTKEQVREAVDDGIAFLREVARILAATYKNSRLGSEGDVSGGKSPPAGHLAARVLQRLGPYRELGLSLAGLNHKQLEAEFADLVPPNLLNSLQASLIAHGRALCRSSRPLCEHCEVRKFCATFRGREVARAARSGAASVVDLFCGPGGLSEGFTRAGFRVLAALDSDPVSIRTFSLNHPGVPSNRIVNRDITSLARGELRRLAGRRVDVLLGAPPCQGFSHVGFRSKRSRTGYRLADDRRNFLWRYMVEAALELRPRVVVMENVPGMNFAPRRENLSFMETARRELERRGRYCARIWRLHAAAFGIPQDRIRFFLVACRDTEVPPAPRGEYKDINQADHDVDALPAIRLDEAIFDLPARAAGSGTAVDLRNPELGDNDPRLRRYLGKHDLRCESPLVYNHHVRYHNKRDLELYSLLRPGEDSVHIIERHGREDLMRYRRDVFDDKYHKLRPDRPSKTIVAHLAKDGNGYVHPWQDRSISVREAARLQSFHDGYVFCGSPSDQWVQVGNAVPPLLAEVIARTLLPLLSSRARR